EKQSDNHDDFAVEEPLCGTQGEDGDPEHDKASPTKSSVVLRRSIYVSPDTFKDVDSRFSLAGRKYDCDFPIDLIESYGHWISLSTTTGGKSTSSSKTAMGMEVVEEGDNGKKAGDKEDEQEEVVASKKQS
ncbi:unnamed protein product, partial [Amoebophrya sp. A25]